MMMAHSEKEPCLYAAESIDIVACTDYDKYVFVEVRPVKKGGETGE